MKLNYKNIQYSLIFLNKCDAVFFKQIARSRWRYLKWNEMKYMVQRLSYSKDVSSENSFRSFPSSPFLTSFGGKGSFLRRWVVIQPSSDCLLIEVFRGFLRVNARRSLQSPRYHLIITLIISDRRDCPNTRDKWPLARNPNSSWWYRHTSIKHFFSRSSRLHGQQGRSYWRCLDRHEISIGKTEGCGCYPSEQFVWEILHCNSKVLWQGGLISNIYSLD